MSNDPRSAEFSFLDFASTKRTPGPADHSKNGVATAVSATSARGSVSDSNVRASGPHTEAEYAERVAASRRLGLVMGLVIVAIFSIVQWVAS